MKRGEPGRRFQDVHEARQERPSARWSRVLWLVLGSVLVVLGPLAGLIPGPGGIVLFLAGAVILARELRVAAVALDWSEQKLRAGWKKVRGKVARS